MLRIFLIMTLALAGAGATALAQEEAPAQEPEAVAAAETTVAISFGTGVDRQTRALTGEAQQFPADVGQVYCFSHITGVDAPAVITHAWYHEGNTMARVDLPVGSADWRTWSSKLVLPGWRGAWEVKVLDAAGKVLGSAGFELQ